jgi:hypothetical protein
MTYWSYDATTGLMSIYSRDASNQPMVTLEVDQKMAHNIAAMVDRIHAQGVANGKAEMWAQICSSVGKTERQP